MLRALFCLLLSALAAFAQQRTDFSRLDAIVNEELRASVTPGAAVAVVEGDRVIFAKGYGVASVETGAAVSPDMLFRLGSTTKMMTAAALVSLAEEGKLDLRKPVGAYLPWLPRGLAALTAHQLLTHTAGLKDEAPMNGSHDDEALETRIRGWTDEFIAFEPGRIYSYSNPGYTLAGLLLEKVGGKPYADMMAERVFTPLGMKRTSLRPLIAMTYPLAQGHRATGGKAEVIRPAADYAGGWPSGSVFTSVEDFSRFTIAFMNGGKIEGKQALAAAIIAKMSEPYVDTYGPDDSRYGYGLTIGDYRGVHMLSHGGSREGYGSSVRMAPERRIAVIVLGNRSGSGLPKTTDAAVDLALGLGPKPEEKPRPPISMTAAEMAHYVGTYRAGEQSVELFERSGKLYLRQGQTEAEVTKTGEHRFTFAASSGARPVFFALVPGADGSGEYLLLGGRVRRRVK